MDDYMKLCASNYLKMNIAKCTETEQQLFKQMYSHKNLTLPIEEIIDSIPEEKLDWAVGQVRRTLESRKQ